MQTKWHNLLQIPEQSGTGTPSFPLLVWPVWRRVARGRFPRGTGFPHSEWTLPPPHWWSPGYWWSALVSRTRCLSPSQTAHPQLGSSGATIRHAGKKNPKMNINLVKSSVIEKYNVCMHKILMVKHYQKKKAQRDLLTEPGPNGPSRRLIDQLPRH